MSDQGLEDKDAGRMVQVKEKMSRLCSQGRKERERTKHGEHV